MDRLKAMACLISWVTDNLKSCPSWAFGHFQKMNLIQQRHDYPYNRVVIFSILKDVFPLMRDMMS